MDVVETYFEAVANNDIDAITSVITEDFTQFPPPAGVRQDRDEFIAEWRQRIEDDPTSALKYERAHSVTERIKSGPREGEWIHEWGTYRRTDGLLTFKLNASFRITEGKVSEIHAFFDRLDVMTQAGFTLAPPQVG